MSSQSFSSPVLSTPRIPAFAFRSLFTVCAVFVPMLLIVYAFAISPEAIERAQIIVHGLESTVLALLAALVLRVYFVFATNSDPSQLTVGSSAAIGTTSA